MCDVEYLFFYYPKTNLILTLQELFTQAKINIQFYIFFFFLCTFLHFDYVNIPGLINSVLTTCLLCFISYKFCSNESKITRIETNCITYTLVCKKSATLCVIRFKHIGKNEHEMCCPYIDTVVCVKKPNGLFCFQHILFKSNEVS